MTNNNKILTVSYGTFSCTLEGFDDSFGTMKAIAEYFRDLASDDRYFGAEPPQPDAEMLARIAEREISRRVEAREDKGRIVLSAGEAEVAQAPAAAALAPVTVPEQAPEPEQVPDIAEVEEAEVETAEVPEVADVEEPTQEDVVEATTPVAEDITPEPVLPEAVAEADDTTDVAEIEDSAEAFFADVTEDAAPEMTAQDATDAVEDAATLAPDSIAAKLQRIRAVVSQHQDDDDEDAMFEDEHAEDLAPSQDVDDAIAADTDQSAFVAETVDAIESAQSDEDSTEADVAEDEDDISSILSRFDTNDEAVAEQSDIASDMSDDISSDAAEETSQDNDDDLGLDSLAALMARDTEDEVYTAEAEENLFEDSVEAINADEDEDLAAPAPRRARVIKVKRADIDAAIAKGQIEEVADDDATATSTLSDEEEAELLADLAQVEAELPDDAHDATFEDALDEDLIGDIAEDDVSKDADAHDVIAEDDLVEDDIAEDIEVAAEAESEETKVNDDDVSRLMAEADNQMDEPEGSSRRNAFAHLKAAVAAKKADAGIGSKDEEEEGAFRSDLASVVKPRRPTVSSSRGERPSAERPAPLKLVAEQRVDVEAAPKGPVRPRRVAAVQEVTHDTEDEGNFADYASDMGAHTLPDLLEAAASYLSFVEGRDQFSRPQLMSKVRQVEERDFSREDGLRSFGQLLRAGKIEKIKGGRFTVTGDIGYRPDQRAAG
ncbi:hypothetical protein [uncultured Tateyamaria sp.]|uniref:hypothetical protein n=1 Tax=uncultured Tateyamaria sp. TaxID=455651 RepID=UPI002601A288|nr:hypothetical protein [uncultured Tateyamaria sp.]